MAVLNLDLAIDTDRDGRHIVVFPQRFQDLNPPKSHSERMQWIKKSFDVFYTHVREIETLGRREV